MARILIQWNTIDQLQSGGAGNSIPLLGKHLYFVLEPDNSSSVDRWNWLTLESVRITPMSFQQPDDSSKHQSDHGEDEKSRGGGCAVFVVLREPAAAAEPAECALDDPAPRPDDEPFGGVGAFDDFER